LKYLAQRTFTKSFEKKNKLESKIHRRFESILVEVNAKRNKIESKYRKLNKSADEQAEVWQEAIMAIVNERK
jgi:adenylate kinase